MSAEVGVRVLAEGIETPAERDFLFNEGVSLMQGYLFSRPAFEARGEIDPKAWPANQPHPLPA